jgi:hypothetical protein
MVVVKDGVAARTVAPVPVDVVTPVPPLATGNVPVTTEPAKLIEPAVFGMAFNTELTKKLSTVSKLPAEAPVAKTTVVPLEAV